MHQTGPVAPRSESLSFLVIDRWFAPLVRLLREDLDRRGTDRSGTGQGRGYAATGRDVST